MAEKKINVFPSENANAPLVVVNATGDEGETIDEDHQEGHDESSDRNLVRCIHIFSYFTLMPAL